MAGVKEYFQQNLAVISRRYPPLAKKLLETEPDRCFHLAESKTGKPVPVYSAGSEKTHINSPYDPEKESERIGSAAVDAGGFSTAYLLLGLDAGYLLHFLLSQNIELLLVVECNISYLRFLIDSFNLTTQLSDPRLRLITSNSPEAASSALLEEYLPLLHGNIAIIPRRPRERMNEAFFSDFRNKIPDVLRNAAVDISTQKKFGHRWMRNIVSNAEAAALAGKKNYGLLSGFSGGKIHVTAAGPSLEDSLHDLASPAPGDCIVATDTSLPSLLAAGARPDFVVSVDCQLHSYHHFLQGIPKQTLLVPDLTSPPLLYRTGNTVVPMAGGHPFSRYLSRFFFPFIDVDTSGGNVTHAAVSFADRLAGKVIVLHGADFSYPQGKLYAKESYLYSYFRSGENRTLGLDTLFARMLLERNDLFMDYIDGGSLTYRTTLLESYKQNLEAAAARITTPLITAHREGQPPSIETSSAPRPFWQSQANELHQETWVSFCKKVLRDLDNLEIPNGAVNTILDGLSSEKKHLLVSLMPLSAMYKKDGSRQKGGALLETARHEARRLLRRALSRHENDPSVAHE
jgi:hypothetical protein